MENFLNDLKAVITAAAEKTDAKRNVALLETTKKMLLNIGENCVSTPATIKIGGQIIVIPTGQEGLYSSLPDYIPAKAGIELVEYIKNSL